MRAEFGTVNSNGAESNSELASREIDPNEWIEQATFPRYDLTNFVSLNNSYGNMLGYDLSIFDSFEDGPSLSP